MSDINITTHRIVAGVHVYEIGPRTTVAFDPMGARIRQHGPEGFHVVTLGPEELRNLGVELGRRADPILLAALRDGLVLGRGV